jgi:hypothetical protein
MGGVVFAELGIDDCVAVVAVELGNMVALFDTCLRADDALNIGDKMGTLS